MHLRVVDRHATLTRAVLANAHRIATRPFRSKNGKPIAAPLNATALEVLRRQMGKHPQSVFTYAGKPVARVNTRAWGKALKRAGIENFRWHDTRHTWATWHRQSGTPTHELQRLGGWRSSVMVERYALAPDHLARAANRLDSMLSSYDLATPETEVSASSQQKI
jgi:integrase